MSHSPLAQFIASRPLDEDDFTRVPENQNRLLPRRYTRMNKVSHFPRVVLFCLPLLYTAGSLAESPFDGTWKNEPSKEKHDPKPLVEYIAQG